MLVVLSVFRLMDPFFFRCACAKKITQHARCGYFQASLCVVRDLVDVIGLRLLGLCAALCIDNMALSFYFLLVENKPSMI
jgi:hypothetical protein